MREIYSFTIDKLEKVKKTETITNEKGEQVEQTKTVEEKVPHKFIIKRPSRAESDEAEEHRAEMESKYIRKGILTAALLEKTIMDSGDVFTAEQKEKYKELTNSFVAERIKYDDLLKIKDEDRTDEQKEEIKVKITELSKLLDEIQKIKNVGATLYDRTAEVLARNATCRWLTLMLSYQEKDGKNIPVFGEGDYKDKLKAFDAMEEKQDDFDYKLIQKLLLAVSLWYLGRCTTKQDFDDYFAMAEQSEELGLT